MKIESIERDFKNKVSEKLRLSSEGINRYRVFTPFMFEDGDHLSILLKRKNGEWMLSDEGHTYMHLTYDLEEKDLQRGTRQKIITNALSMFSVQDREGELILPIENERYGDALYNFVQSLLKITDVPTFHGNEFGQPSWKTSGHLWKKQYPKNGVSLNGSTASMIQMENIRLIAG